MNGQPKVDAPKSDRFSLRHAWRIKLAKLLTEGQFEMALNEAARAQQQGEILEVDVHFVEKIATAAKGQAGPTTQF